MGSSRFNEVLEAAGPTTDTFFRGEPHWSDTPDADAALIAATEERLDVALPSLLLFHPGSGLSPFHPVQSRAAGWADAEERPIRLQPFEVLCCAVPIDFKPDVRDQSDQAV